MSFNLMNKVFDFLKENPEQKFTAQDISDWIVKTYPDDCRQKQERSKTIHNTTALRNQIVREIYSQRPRLQKRHAEIKTTEGSPRKYYFTEATDHAEIERAENKGTTKTNSNPVTEHKLYPILSEFLWSELGIYSKRIDEKHSRNKQGAGGNKWLYPDLVGLDDLSHEWHDEIKDCVHHHGDKKTKLWSLEVKVLVNRSNLREAFFQAVSNSTWANFGYLVAGEIGGTDTLKELRMLASLHGLGFIKLSTEDPSESQIMIPARERNAVDWDTANRLTQENKDFLNYIKLVRQFYQTGDIRPSDWDGCTNQSE